MRPLRPKTLFLIIFSIIICSYVLSPSYARNLRQTSDFGAYFANGGSVGFILDVDQGRNLTLTVSSGTLNSSESELDHIYDDGVFRFNSSSSGSLRIDFNNVEVNTYVNGSRIGGAVASGYTQNFGVSDLIVIEWSWGIVDLTDLYTMPFIGLSGIIMLCFGAFSGALEVRNFSNESSDSLFMLGIYFVIAIIGAALIVVWLW